MADKEYLKQRRFDLVAGIASKVRQDAYAAYQKTGKQKYRRVDEPVTPEIVVGHLTGAQPIACYAVFDDQTYTAVLDFDDHDKTLSWDALVAAAQPIYYELRRLGFKPLCCRSGGGSGLHIWIVWDASQSAKLVKQFLRHLLETQGFKHGTGGVQQKEIEVFPKNDRVKEGSYGNAVALPYSRSSVPLGDDLQPLDWLEFQPPTLEDLLSPDVSDVFTPQTPSSAASKTHRQLDEGYDLRSESWATDQDKVRAALQFVSADSYETWTTIGLAVKCSLGDAAFEIWDEWSSNSAKYEGSAACREVWESFDPNGTLTIGTVFHLAKEGGWKPRAGKPTILVEQGNLPYEVDQAEDALIAGNVGVYQRGNQLVRVSKIPKQISEDGVERPGGALVLTKVVSPWLREQFARSANWEKPVKNGTKPINPPFEHAAAYIARVGEWRVPVLNGIIATPTLRADGSILQEPGFDFESGLLYDPRGVEYAPVPEAPSRDQAVEALDVLLRPFREFPFADAVAKSVLVTAALTALIRRSLPTAPMFAVDAPTAGSGKTYIAQTIGIIATGHIPTLIAQGKSDEEDEKRISTVLIAGDPIVVVDNCERAISGDALCGVLTAETWGARILGKSELAKVPTNTLFMATGNNLVVAGDMARRILVCRLDPRMENPEQAEYDFDPRTEATEHRTEIVSAGLTILRAFITAGRPKQSKPLGSFNEWNLVRDAVIWLGLPDPAITVERNKVDDPLKSELSNLLELWVTALGEKEVGLADIGIEAEQSRSPQINELHQALASMTRNGQFNTKSIGRLLRKHIDRIVNGRALRKNSGPSGSLLYRVEILDRQKLTDADDGGDETEFPF